MDRIGVSANGAMVALCVFDASVQLVVNSSSLDIERQRRRPTNSKLELSAPSIDDFLMRQTMEDGMPAHRLLTSKAVSVGSYRRYSRYDSSGSSLVIQHRNVMTT